MRESIQTALQIGEAVRAARNTQKLTLKQAAGLCGVGVRFLSELENGKESAELGRTLRVLRRLGLQVHIKQKGAP